MTNKSSSSLDLFKLIRNSNAQAANSSRLHDKNSSDNSESEAESDEWKKLKKTSKLKILAAGFLKCAFSAQSTKSIESLKSNPNKFKNSLQHPESFQIMKSLYKLSSITSKHEQEKDHTLNPGFIDMVSKTMIKSRNKRSMARTSQEEDDKELEKERLKILQIIIEGNHTPANKYLLKDDKKNVDPKKSAFAKKKIIAQPLKQSLSVQKIPKLLLPLELVNPNPFKEVSSRELNKSASPRSFIISQRLYPKERHTTHKEMNHSHIEPMKRHCSPYLTRLI
ncbi:unnamed protein product [Blepharisma stoltei]|uniref:Uncharacterized protein n=1 Tax=Blepharisma stoltei TaxID=1481888 RepID=A0AAU9JJU2_9CILI|nr:unnamed protein product [Blepharisma stoltei]